MVQNYSLMFHWKNNETLLRMYKHECNVKAIECGLWVSAFEYEWVHLLDILFDYLINLCICCRFSCALLDNLSIATLRNWLNYYKPKPNLKIHALLQKKTNYHDFSNEELLWLLLRNGIKWWRHSHSNHPRVVINMFVCSFIANFC